MIFEFRYLHIIIILISEKYKIQTLVLTQQNVKLITRSFLLYDTFIEKEIAQNRSLFNFQRIKRENN